MEDREYLEILNVENLQREDVHPLDEADGYKRRFAAANYANDAAGHETLGWACSRPWRNSRRLIPALPYLATGGGCSLTLGIRGCSVSQSERQIEETRERTC